MDYITSILTVFIAGMLELWLAIPLGWILKLSPLVTAVTSSLGSIVAAIIVALAGSDLRSRFLKWRYSTDSNLKESRIYKIWNKYGIIGLGLLSPLLFGSPLGTAIGIILGADKNRLLLWISIGIVIWGTGLTTALYLGLISMNMNV